MIRASTLALALALGFAAAPAIASPPGATPSKTPARANCGTAWTGWTEDPNTDLNPCPKNCERGERQLVKSYKQGDKTLFSARYQCYRAAAGAPAITTERLAVNGLAAEKYSHRGHPRQRPASEEHRHARARGEREAVNAP